MSDSWATILNQPSEPLFRFSEVARLQYFHNPLQPTGGGVNKEKASALSIWNKIESALRKASNSDQILFHAEAKRLCLVVEAALEVWDPQAKPDLDAKTLFLRQLSVQMRIFSHMRKLTAEKVEAAGVRASAKSAEDKTKSGAEHSLDALRLEIKLTEEQLLEGIGVQPLATVLVEHQDLFNQLGEVFFHIHDHVTKRRADVERTLGQLLTLHARKQKDL